MYLVWNGTWMTNRCAHILIKCACGNESQGWKLHLLGAKMAKCYLWTCKRRKHRHRDYFWNSCSILCRKPWKSSFKISVCVVFTRRKSLRFYWTLPSCSADSSICLLQWSLLPLETWKSACNTSHGSLPILAISLESNKSAVLSSSLFICSFEP